jgi:class 3 adenylate cyclase
MPRVAQPAKGFDSAIVASTHAVTFLFTDIEGSTRLCETEPTRMARRRSATTAFVVFRSERIAVGSSTMLGDGLHAASSDPADAVATVLDLQRGITTIARDSGLSMKIQFREGGRAARRRRGRKDPASERS